MNWKILLGVVAFLLLLVAGCQVLNDLWPARIPQAAITYLEKDPNTAVIQCLGDAKEFRNEVISKYIETQLGLEYQMRLDDVRYSAAIEQTNLHIQTALNERESMIGTIDKPGWLLSVMLGASGLGLYMTGLRTQRTEDYNEAELEVEIIKRNGSK